MTSITSKQQPSTFDTIFGIGGCHYVPWQKAHKMPDPTRVFSLLVITIMVFRFLVANDWNVSLVMTGFFLNVYVVAFFSLACAVFYLSKPLTPLPVYDQWTAEWYFWNAWLYHMVMDGASGSFRLVPVVVQQYDILDQRFPKHHVVPWLIGSMELFLMAPLCLLTLWAIQKRHVLRFPLELVTSTFQMAGMIVFVGAEVYEGQFNIPALDPVGTKDGLDFKFNMYHLVYYWFGFWFCNLVWGVIPYFRIMRAVNECRFAFTQSAMTANGISKKSQ
ncbi:hypothetical protein MPSEU_000012500 [Mayamaea pseudoterrestris]|nr:hypothetical protein MPSEU_000012500 [Mayamaea pseudoterrestris]